MAGEGISEQSDSKELKMKADEAFRAQDFQAAVALYTQALVWTPMSETILSNRSAAYAASGNFKAALEDAVKCDSSELSFFSRSSRLFLLQFNA